VSKNRCVDVRGIDILIPEKIWILFSVIGTKHHSASSWLLSFCFSTQLTKSWLSEARTIRRWERAIVRAAVRFHIEERRWRNTAKVYRQHGLMATPTCFRWTRARRALANVEHAWEDKGRMAYLVRGTNIIPSRSAKSRATPSRGLIFPHQIQLPTRRSRGRPSRLNAVMREVLIPRRSLFSEGPALNLVFIGRFFHDSNTAITEYASYRPRLHTRLNCKGKKKTSFD